MKTAISLPDDIFQLAERMAKRTRKSRSQLYSEALREYLERHTSDEVTEAMDNVIDEIGEIDDEFISAASSRALNRVEW